MSANFVYDPFRFTFANQSEVIVNHGKDRYVDVVAFDHSGDRLYPRFEELMPGSTRVRFYSSGQLVQVTGEGYIT